MITITDMLGWIGTVVSICFFASPVLQFYNLIKKKIIYRDINILIILGNFISSIVWLIYGFSINLKQIKICYAFGALLSLIWLWTYLIYMGKRKMTQAMIFTMLLSIITFGIVILLTVVITDKKIIGEICFIFCSISYISPSQLIIKVINSKNYNLIPIYSAIISSVGYGSWTIFGLFNFNVYIIIPNLVGILFSLIQIILYRVYKNKTPLTEELSNISTTVMGAMKNVVDKTVQIANSITPTATNTQTNENNTNTLESLNVKKIGNTSTNENNVGNSTISENNNNNIDIKIN